MTLPKDLDLEGVHSTFQHPRTAIIPMITGPLSAFGSYLVIRELWGDRTASSSAAMATASRSRMRAPVVRALLSLSIVDFLSSIAMGLSTVPVPSSEDHVPFAVGNFATCDAQGFFIQLSVVAIPLYTTLLTFFYLVTIKYQWTDIRIRKVEIWVHSVILTISLGCSIFPIPLELYNNTYHYCWFHAFPYGCEPWDEDVACERGGDYLPYMVAFAVVPLWPCLLAVSIIMCQVHSAVRAMEGNVSNQTWGNVHSSAEMNKSTEITLPNSQQYLREDGPVTNDDNHGAGQVNRSRSRAVARQAMLFVLAFVLANALKMGATIWTCFTKELNNAFTVLALDVMQPSQGLFNAIVLLRTRKLSTPEGRLVQKAFHASCSMAGAMWQGLLSLCSCCCWLQSSNVIRDVERNDSSDPTATSEARLSETQRRNHVAPGNLYTDSLDVFGAKESNLFKDGNLLQIVSSADQEDDSIAERERAAVAMLNDDNKKLYSEMTDVQGEGSLVSDKVGTSTQAESGIHNDKDASNEMPQIRMPASSYFVSDLTEDCHEEQTFEELVVEESASSSRLPNLYESVQEDDHHEDATHSSILDTMAADHGRHAHVAKPIDNDLDTVIDAKGSEQEEERNRLNHSENGSPQPSPLYNYDRTVLDDDGATSRRGLANETPATLRPLYNDDSTIQ